MKKAVQKDWKDILWESMSKEEKEKENIFQKSCTPNNIFEGRTKEWPAKKS